jgi:hypothetical protein
VTEIGEDAFSGCDSLTEIRIPACIKRIGANAFPEQLVFFGSDYLCVIDHALVKCLKSAKRIIIPDSVRVICDHAFESCARLTEVTIPDSVVHIGSRAFCECLSLTHIEIPYGVTSIGEYAFNSCPSLKSVTIPDSVTEIGDMAFSSCRSLENVTIPDSVTSLGKDIFWMQN